GVGVVRRHAQGVLVVVALMAVVQVAVMQVVDVAVVLDGSMTAAGAVDMVVIVVRVMRHGDLLVGESVSESVSESVRVVSLARHAPAARAAGCAWGRPR